MAEQTVPGIRPVAAVGGALVSRSLLLDLGLFAGFAIAVGGRQVPSLSWLALAYLLVVPGDLLRRTLAVSVTSVAQRLILAVSGSVAVLIATAALIEGIGKVVGIQRPFESDAVPVGMLLVALALVCVAHREGAATPGPTLPQAGLGPLTLAVLAPMCVAAGSSLLDNQRGPWLLLVGFGFAATILLRGVIGPSEQRAGNLLLGSYTLSLAILWSFAMRTPFLYGFDINPEYGSYATTMDTGYWAPQAGSAYNAMLSLTAVPAILAQSTGVSGMLLFKVAYPMVFAIFPVAGMLIALSFVSAGPALIATIILCLNPAGFWQIAAVARQEIALTCFAGLLTLLLTQVKSSGRTALAVALGLACVFSHYSTSYVAIALLLIAAILQRVIPRIRRRRDRRADIPLLVPLLMLAVAAAWNLGINQAAGNLQQAGGSFASNQGLSQQINPIETWLKGTNPVQVTPRELFGLSADEAVNRKWLVPYPAAVQAEFRAVPASGPAPPAPFSGLAGIDYLSFTLLRQAVLLTIVGGTAAMVISSLRQKSIAATAEGDQPIQPPANQKLGLTGPAAVTAVALSISAVVIAAVMRSSTTLSLAYNPERLFTQLSLVFVIPLGLVLRWLLSRLRPHWRRAGIAALAVVGVLAVLDATGVRGLLVGTTAGNLQSTGEHVERYVQTPADVAAADWLQSRFASTNQVYTDRYGALLLRSRPEFANGLLSVLTPALLDQRGYVLGTSENVVGGRARSQIDGKFAVYQFPVSFLDKYKARVYTNGSAGVWN